MIGQTIKHYTILEKLGEGGMGVVYKAQDTKLDRTVALKFLPQHLTADAAERERFVHEARAASALNHPNITTIHEIDEVDGKMFIVMEYCEGRTLRHLIETENLSIKRVLEIAIQACEGLALAHEKGVVHRDIKSDNIMLTPRNQVKIMDFGLAKLKGSSKLTRTGSTLGTASYMSPEQAQGEDVDRRSDIFSFGIVLYEMITRQLPFRGEHQSAITYSIVNEEPQPLARYNNQVSPRLEEIVSKALAKDRDERYQHIDDLLADLRRERKALEYVKTAQVPTAAPAEQRKRRTRLLTIGIPAAAVIVLVLLMVIFNPFNLQIGQQKSVAGEQNSVAVMYFENIPDPADIDHTGEMLVNLLITSLSQTRGLDVVSRERLYEIQKDLGQTNQKSLSPSLATQIASRAGVRTMLLGSIVQMKPTLVITTRLVDVQSGKILGSERLTGFSAEKIFALVDSLAERIRTDLNVVSGETPVEQSVAAVTTTSPEAYRSYVMGVDLVSKYYYEEAFAAIQRAIELDKNFAMAYFVLSQLHIASGNAQLSADAIRKAYDLKSRVTEKERLRIEAAYLSSVDHNYGKAAEILETYVQKYPREPDPAIELSSLYMNLGNFEKSRSVLEAAVAANPQDKDVLNLYAYILAGNNDRTGAMRTVDRYLALAPAEPNPYDSKGELCFVFGEVDSALFWYQKAITLRRDFNSSEKIGWIHLMRGDYAGAAAAFDQLRSTSSVQQQLQAALDGTLAPAHRGRFGEARRIAEQILHSRQMEAVQGQEFVPMYEGLSILSDEMGDYSSALSTIRACSDLLRKGKSNTVYLRDAVAFAQMRAGDAEGAEATLDAMRKDNPNARMDVVDRVEYMRGVLAYLRGDYQRATAQMGSVLQKYLPNRGPEYYYAVALLKSGRSSEAMAELKRLTWWCPISYPPISLLNLPVSTYWPIGSVKAHYWLGVAYEQQGNRQDAIKEYETFLSIWKDAEKEWPEMADARARLAKLKQGSA